MPTTGAEASAPGSLVDIAEGRIEGSRDANGVLSFKGVPFAAAPVGDLRWRPPRPHPGWAGTRRAHGFGPRAMGPPCLSPDVRDMPMAEDCLFLDVWTAATGAEAAMPVMVWIHGGGFQTGASAEPNHDGSLLAARGVVVVSVNYRLGVLGFLAHPLLDAEGAPSGNFGLQDQIAALKWVRRNITAFGGDPGNVTIFGESAGAASVALLMASPLAAGLFHRAIGESGNFWEGRFGSLKTHERALAQGTALCRRAGTDLEGLRRLPAEDLLFLAPWRMPSDPVTQGFSPSVDGHVVPDHPLAVLAEGRQNDVPLLAGWNGAEGATFVFWALPHGDGPTFADAASVVFGPDAALGLLRYYPAGSPAEAARSAIRLIGDLTVCEQSRQWLSLHDATGRSPVYAYLFDVRSAYTPEPAHTTEIDYVFGTVIPHQLGASAAPPDERDRSLSNEMMSYWIAFAKSGDPNVERLPPWPARDGSSATMVFSYERTGAREVCDEAGLTFITGLREDAFLPARWAAAAPIPR